MGKSTRLAQALRQRLPESLELILNPLLTTLITASLAIVLLQPLGGMISETIAHGATLAIDRGGVLVGGAVGGAVISYAKVATLITFGLSGLPLALTMVAGKVMMYLAGWLTAVICGFLFAWFMGFNDPEE